MKTKVCTKCGITKSLDEFNKNNEFKDGLSYWCKLCMQDCSKQFKENFPWIVSFRTLRRRCNDKNHDHYKYYGGRGIKCLLTEEEVKKLWFRDKAYLLKQPSIDRIDNDKDYVFENCRYKELGQNVAERNKRLLSKAVIQSTLDGVFIREFFSLTDAAKATNQSHANIGYCAKGITKQAGGYIWRYKETK